MAELRISLRKLFKQIAEQKTYLEIAEGAGLDIKPRDAAARLGEALNKNASIDYRLADYILNETIGKQGSFLDEGLAKMRAAGLTPPQAAALTQLVFEFLQANRWLKESETELQALQSEVAKRTPSSGATLKTRDGTVSTIVTVDHDVVPGATVTAVTAPGGKPHPIEIHPVEERRAKVNRRDELKEYAISRHETGHKLPKWLQLAAGAGMDLEKSPDYIYFEEIPDHKGIHSAIIRGASMEDTLFPCDVVILKEYPEGRLELPHIEEKAEKVPLSKWKRESGIQDGTIAVISINDDPPTLKRVFYDTERGEKNWKMQIVADNGREWRHGRPFQVAIGDKIVFHARMIGIGKKPLPNVGNRILQTSVK